MRIEKSVHGYQISVYSAKDFMHKVYVSSYYKGEYSFCTDYTYAKAWKQLDKAKEHARRLKAKGYK